MLRVRVPSMTCGGCAAAIRRTASAVPGVENVCVDLPARAVEISGRVDPAAVCAALKAAGYPVSEADRVALALGAGG